MNRFMLTACLLAAGVPACAQSLSPQQQKVFVAAIRDRYYRPRDAGLANFTCNAKYDMDTVPKALLIPAEVAGRGPLEATQIQLTVNSQGRATVNKAIAPSTSAFVLPLYTRLFDLLGDLVTGFAQTWAAKALNSPISEGDDVLSIVAQPPLEIIHLPYGVQVKVDPKFTVQSIETDYGGQTIKETPSFTPSPQGLLFTEDDANMKQGEQATHIHYTVDYQSVAGFLLPQHVHLIVDSNIDTNFTFTSCTIQRGITLKVGPPPK